MRTSWSFLLLTVGLGCAQPVTVSVLATTDMHGNIYPIDYGTGQPAARGLAKLATLIRQARAENPNNLLIDCGDTIQGTPLEYVYQTLVRTGKPPLNLTAPKGVAAEPMMTAMNLLGYDSMTVGNHEYNFGLKNFINARSTAHFPWLSANTVVAPGGAQKPFGPYIVKTVGGVKVAVIGLTTPAVPSWEKPENYGSYRFLPAVDAARKAIAELRAKERPDVIIVAAHAGLGRDLTTNKDEGTNENFVYELATKVPEIDVIFHGHTHAQMEAQQIGRVLVVQPKNWAISVARLDLTMERKAGGWSIAKKQSRLIAATMDTEPAADILELAKPYHELAEAYLNTPVATAPRELEAALGRVQDTPLVDAVHRVQLFYAKADVSLTAMFNPSLRVPKGQVTVRQLAALYPYDNELYLVEGTGAMLKAALENAARFYLSCQGDRCGQPPLTNRSVVGFNYDMAEGVEYEVDLTRPEGDRIRNLRYRGKPLDPAQKLRIAINNYRAAGSAGYSMFLGAKELWRSGEEIRDMMVRYYTDRKVLPETASGNWRVVPEAARQTLEREARGQLSGPALR